MVSALARVSLRSSNERHFPGHRRMERACELDRGVTMRCDGPRVAGFYDARIKRLTLLGRRRVWDQVRVFEGELIS